MYIQAINSVGIFNQFCPCEAEGNSIRRANTTVKWEVYAYES